MVTIIQPSPRPIERALWRPLAWADAACNRLYGWRYNPLYQSGTIVVALFVVLMVTGTWLLLFYRVSEPYASVERLTANPWYGNWVRAMHRYASDAALVAIAVHMLRMFSQGRSWGPRAMAWVSGVVLLVLTLASGWTGYVMVWDVFGELLARECARMIDALPVLSEPLSRAFSGERPVLPIIFFLNLFAHVGVPLSMLAVLWLHTSRLARPAFLPPRPLLWAVIGALFLLALVRPMQMAAEANALRVPDVVPADWFYAFWIPLTRSLSGGAAFAAMALGFGGLAIIPMLMKRRGDAAPPKSFVHEEICVGCRQCSLDCPYEAIAMIPRAAGDTRSEEVARVNPDRCVSCGICAGSCAPMGVGPPGRSGRDQVANVRAFIVRPERREGELVVVACTNGAAAFADALSAEGAAIYPVSCAGSLHTSVIELLVRSGCAGVLVLACPPRDCWNREGPRWLDERVYHDREAELQARVDRRHVRIASANASELGAAIALLREFRASLPESAGSEANPAIDLECVPANADQVSRR